MIQNGVTDLQDVDDPNVIRRCGLPLVWKVGGAAGPSSCGVRQRHQPFLDTCSDGCVSLHDDCEITGEFRRLLSFSTVIQHYYSVEQVPKSSE